MYVYLHCIEIHLQCFDAEVDTNSGQVCRDENLLFVSFDDAGLPNPAVSYENNFEKVVVFWIHVFGGKFVASVIPMDDFLSFIVCLLQHVSLLGNAMHMTGLAHET